VKKALVVGGTGPTGPMVVQGLLDRDYHVTIYHRGFHETDDLPQGIHRHLHGDPFTKEVFEKDFASQEFDLVVSMYGRLRHIADVLANRTPKLVGVGGSPSLMKPEHLPFPQGLEVPLPEDHPLYTNREIDEYGFAVAHTERRVMEHHQQGHFAVVMFRYPWMYGPRNGRQWMWPIVRRVLDNRKVIIVPGDGSQVRPICYSDNAVRQLLLACDSDVGNGHAFNSVDEVTYTIKDTIKIIAAALGHEFETVEISHPLAYELANGYAPRYSRILDAAPLKKLLGYRDAVPPAQGLAITARWLVDNKDSLNLQQMEELAANPFAYDIEDQLIASFKNWQSNASASIPRPQIKEPAREWRGRFRPAPQNK
jgi:nucleoside-diphosphate-sugar epimerase